MKPKFTFMTNEANALGKMRAGFKPDVVHPCVGYVKDFADSGFVQPWNPALLKNLKHLNPAMVKAGQIGGKQWWIPADWGFDKILYRTDKVQPKEKSWSLMLDDRYKGKIAWFDDLNQLVWAGYYLGFKKPVRPDRRRAQEVTGPAQVEEGQRPHVLVVGDRPPECLCLRGRLDRLCLARRLRRDEGEEAARCLHAPEGRCALVGLWPHARQGLAARRGGPRLCRRVELDDSRRRGWRRTTPTARANTKARPADAGLAKALQLDNPKSVSEPFAHIDRYIPRRSVYAEAVGRGQGLLSRPGAASDDDDGRGRRRTGGACRRRRLGPHDAGAAGLPLAWLLVFFVVPIVLRRRLQRRCPLPLSRAHTT